jgi:phosphoribosyl-ATP pyrophosphohydrolase
VAQSEPAVLARLMAVIEERKQSRPSRSYTRTLLDGGVGAIGGKICEEAAEVVEAARLAGEDRGRAVVYEAADLVYHLLVMLAHCGVGIVDVEAELERRFGTSGIDEKARRDGSGDAVP